MRQTFKAFSLFILFSSAHFASAIEVNKCPVQLLIQVGQPTAMADYAKVAYEKYFAKSKVLSAELKLVRTSNAQCVYEADAGAGDIFSASITGSLRAGSVNPATLTIFANIDVGPSSNGDIDIGSIAIYSWIATLSPYGISFIENGRLYRRDEVCSYGECAPGYISMGKFELLKVQVP